MLRYILFPPGKNNSNRVMRDSVGIKIGAHPCHVTNLKELVMGIGTILLIVLILILVGALPVWPHSSSWGYGPTGGLGLIVVILIILVLMGKI